MSVIEKVSKVRRAHEILTGQLGREPTEGEITARLGWEEKKVQEVLCLPVACFPDAL